MALGVNQLTKIRQGLASKRNPNWTKAQVNAAAQAVDSEITNAIVAAHAAIDALGFSFNVATKNKIILLTYKERAG